MDDAPAPPPDATPPSAPWWGARGNEDDTLDPAEVAGRRRAAVLGAFPAGARIGEYEILAPLGMGAMGAVFRARHPRVGHDVALKVLHGAAAAPEARARFQREARAAARLAGHPGIAAVHDVGEEGDLGWFAMDLVPGITLQHAVETDRLSDDDALGCLEQAARAAAHAHAAGVLHRDLKPSNILLVAEAGAPDGAWRAVLTDFGLAAFSAAGPGDERLTHPGTTLGTPAYMPPEQALGEPLDGRADVYALGATLFHALAGRPPYHGDSVDQLFEALLAGDRPGLAALRPDLATDAVAVVERAMAHAPADRYPTATALADDLARLRAGRPVRARAGVRWRGLGRAVARHPRRWLAAAAAAVALVAGGWWLAASERASHDSADRARAARATGTTLERAAQAAAAWKDLVQHSATALRALEDHARGATLSEAALAAQVAAVDAAAAATTARFPASATPEAWRGLAYVLAGQAEAGRRLLDAAVRRAAGDPLPALLQARTALATWSEGVELPDLSYEDRVRRGVLVESPAMRSARNAATAALAAASESPLWVALDQAPTLHPYLEGVAALVQDAPDRAAELLGPLRDDPLLGPEATMLHGLARFLSGAFADAATDWRQCGARGWRQPALWAAIAYGAAAVDAGAGGTDASPWFEAGIQALDQLLAHHPRWTPARQRLAQLLQMLARDRYEHGADPAPALARGLATVEALLADAPGFLPALEARALLRFTAADVGQGDRAALCRAAIADWSRVLAAVPDVGSSLVNRGAARRKLAADLAADGQDPLPLLRAALQDLDRAIEVRAFSVAARLARVQVRVQIAQAEARAGTDPTPALRDALAELDATRERCGDAFAADLTRGTVHEALAHAAEARGRDPAPAYRAALEAYAAAAARDAGRPDASVNASMAWRALAEAQRARGVDVRPTLQQALAAADRALELRPGAAALLSNRALIYLDLADDAANRGADPHPQVARALEDADAAVAAAPQFSAAVANRGAVRNRLADLARGAGDAVGAWTQYEQALADYSAAITLEPGNLEARNGRALVRKERGALLLARRADPTAELEQAVADFTAVLAAAPGHVAARNNRGTTRLDLAGAARAQGRDDRSLLEAARTDFDAVLAAKPDYLPARLNRGTAWQLEADAVARAQADPAAALEQALADFREVQRRNARYWRAWSAAGWVLQRLGRDAEAIEAYTAALAINPNQPFIRTQLDTLRKR